MTNAAAARRSRSASSRRATGLVFAATVAFVNLLFNHVLVEDIVKIVAGNGVGASGTMHFQTALLS